MRLISNGANNWIIVAAGVPSEGGGGGGSTATYIEAVGTTTYTVDPANGTVQLIVLENSGNVTVTLPDAEDNQGLTVTLLKHSQGNSVLFDFANVNNYIINEPVMVQYDTAVLVASKSSVEDDFFYTCSHSANSEIDRIREATDNSFVIVQTTDDVPQLQTTDNISFDFINLAFVLNSGSFRIQTPQAEPPSPTSGAWAIYIDSGDGNKLKAKASNGTVVTLATP